ncbi:MAG: DUF4129 domain-containing protein [Prevotella sp.]|nr:DUF4129 domain-containing protein [Prevotella sp.]
MASLTDTLSLNKALIQRMRDDYGYVEGLSPDMKWPKDSVLGGAEVPSSNGSNIFSDLFEWLGQVPSFVWYTLLALLVAVALIWILRNISIGKKGKTEEEMEEADLPVDIYAVDQPQEELRRAVAAQDWDQAVRMTYILTLRHLHEAGRIQWLPSKTPMDYVGAVGMAPFLHLTNAFLRVRFGKYPATEQDWHDADAWRKETEKGGEA